jgi:hypothetical protein
MKTGLALVGLVLLVVALCYGITWESRHYSLSITQKNGVQVLNEASR